MVETKIYAKVDTYVTVTFCAAMKVATTTSALVTFMEVLPKMFFFVSSGL